MTAIGTQTSPEVSMSMPKTSSEVEFCAKCECCGLTEECTEAYIKRVREKFQGRWICGLCSEAVKDEVVRSERKNIGTEEALNLHMSFCKKFRTLRSPTTSPLNPTDDDELISAVKQLLFKSLESPRKGSFVRSKSCFSALHH